MIEQMPGNRVTLGQPGNGREGWRGAGRGGGRGGRVGEEAGKGKQRRVIEGGRPPQRGLPTSAARRRRA